VPGALVKGGAAGLASVGLGVVAGIAGVVLTLRGQARQARDDQERRELRSLGLAACAVVVVLCAAIQISAMVRSPMALLGSWLVVAAVQCHLFLVVLPRVTARRRRAELAEDPGAGRRHRRDQRWIAAVVGLGLAGGTATVMLTAWLLWRAAP
jgi:Mn2+/Fe2+ NRAMP family transporter